MWKLSILSVVFSCVFICPMNCDIEPDKWTSCWSSLRADSTLCKKEFGPEWDITGTSHSQECGFLRKKIQCTHAFLGCEATKCYSNFHQADGLCLSHFQGRLPNVSGRFQDCVPGFYRARCCPK